MANKKTSTKRSVSPKKSSKPKSFKINGVRLFPFSPAKELADHPERVAQALMECLIDGDKEVFQEILEGYVRARNILQVSRETKLSRTVIYEAFDRKKDPRLGTICKIMSAFKKAD
ncbi:MAG: hypothetical protein KF789_11545 [Bdellovibrionaceae bacterium]|nr:hypothetical protein [Pseudobdellovibrionaceae bacterium]